MTTDKNFKWKTPALVFSVQQDSIVPPNMALARVNESVAKSVGQETSSPGKLMLSGTTLFHLTVLHDNHRTVRINDGLVKTDGLILTQLAFSPF